MRISDIEERFLKRYEKCQYWDGSKRYKSRRVQKCPSPNVSRKLNDHAHFIYEDGGEV